MVLQSRLGANISALSYGPKSERTERNIDINSVCIFVPAYRRGSHCAEQFPRVHRYPRTLKLSLPSVRVEEPPVLKRKSNTWCEVMTIRNAIARKSGFLS